VLVFSQAVRHTSCPWEQDMLRMALLFCYNHINVRHHKPAFSDEMPAGLTPGRWRYSNEVDHPQFDRW
jgi:hypothetical protein